MEKDFKKLLKQMTLEEKAGLCSGADFWHLKGIERLDIPSIMVTDGPHGLRKQDGESDHVGLSDSVKATCFPTASATASSWDLDLIEEMGVALGEECVQEDVSVLLGPGANIKRSPLCGRNFEYISEDPYLTGKIGAALVNGIQSKGIGTSLKHFAVNNQEYRRMASESLVDERALREIYLAGFEEIVKTSQPWTVMCAYNRVEEKYCSDSKKLLTDILKDEWGHTGLVVTDWGACNDRVEGIKAGLELEMPASGGMNDALIVKAVKDGTLQMAELDKVVMRLLELIYKSTETKRGHIKYDIEAHNTLARKIAANSAVLLKNIDSLLPLADDKKIAVIGDFAKNPRYQGAGSSQIQPIRLKSAIDELDKKNIDYTFYKGYDPTSDMPKIDLIKEAVSGADQTDIAIHFVGLTNDYESEGFDRKHMSMPDAHQKLVEAVSKAYKKVVVVLQNGSPIEMPWLDNVSSVLECYLGGQAGGPAAVDVLYGDVNPSGKLAETFPVNLSDDLATKWFGMGPKTVEYRESVYVGYRYYDTVKEVVEFPFGHGLSYTSFQYSDMKLSDTSIEDSDSLNVTVNIKNIGEVAGAEVVQLYVKDCESTIFRPEKELKGFDKVYLQPNEEKEMTFTLNKRSFAYYNVNIKDWHVETGDFKILLGASSRDIRLTELVQVKSCDDTVTVPDYRTSAPDYYHLDKVNKAIDDKSFGTVLGRTIPSNVIAKGEPHTLNSTLEDVSVTFTGRMLYKVISKNMEKTFGDGLSEANKLMMRAMVNDMPLRSMVLMGGGAFNYEMANGLLMIMNGKVLSGVGKVIKNR